MSILACHGFARGAFLGHSYGSKYSCSYFPSYSPYSCFSSSDPYKICFKSKQKASYLSFMCKYAPRAVAAVS
jgi:hypothetical protein